MGLERRGKSIAYYRKRRMGRLVVSEYVASGRLAVLLFEADRLERRQSREGLKPRGSVDDLGGDEELFAYCDDVGRTINAAIEDCGYHRHSRGPWRKKRIGADDAR